MPDADHGQLDQLLTRLVDKTITVEEFAALEVQLDGDAHAQKRYLHYLGLHADLLETAVTPESWTVQGRGDGVHLDRKRRTTAWLSGAAAALVLLGLSGVLFLRAPDAGFASIVRIAEWNGAVRWTGDGGRPISGLKVGDELAGGTLEVGAADSWAELTFDDGTKVWASGPAIVTFSEGPEGKRIDLRQGELSLDVAPQPSGRPLLLQTPSAEVEVLGTQFNVIADDSATRLAVHEGLVRVTRLADGKTRDVPADHHVVAALERETDFDALPRGESVKSWKCDLQHDVRQGHWLPGGGGSPGSLRAETHLFRGDFGERKDPVLLHSVVVRPSGSNGTPVLLTEGARLRVVGRLERSCAVSFGFGTHRVRGALSGKYALSRKIELAGQEEGKFEIELYLDDIPRMKESFSESPVGQELGWMWIQTVREDIGLEVTSVELISKQE
ncbi:MAG: FecR family protein [Roseibacillus sp.]|nr:FecR family protein [Roseibacillus sp.]